MGEGRAIIEGCRTFGHSRKSRVLGLRMGGETCKMKWWVRSVCSARLILVSIP